MNSIPIESLKKYIDERISSLDFDYDNAETERQCRTALSRKSELNGVLRFIEKFEGQEK